MLDAMTRGLVLIALVVVLALAAVVAVTWPSDSRDDIYTTSDYVET